MTDILPVIASETALIDTPALIDAPILATSQEESDGTTHAACKPAQDGIDSPATQQPESGGPVASQQGVNPAQLKSVPLTEDASLEEGLARPAEALASSDVTLDESEQPVVQSNATVSDESNDACKRSSPAASTAEQTASAPGPTQSQQGRERLTSDVYASNSQSQSHAAETRRQQEHSWAYYCSHLQQHHQYLQHDQSYDYRRYQQHMNAAVPLPAGSYYAKRNLQGLDQRYLQGPLAMNYSDVSSFESYPLAPRDMTGHDGTFSQHVLPQPYAHGGFFQAPLPQYGSYYYSGQPDPRDYAGPGGHYARPMPLGDNKSYDHSGGPSRASRFEPGLPSPGLSRHPRGQFPSNMPLGALGNVPTSTAAPLYSMLNTGLGGLNASSSTPLSRNKHVFDQADQMARERMELTSSASAPAWLGQTHSTSHGLHSEALGAETAHHGDEANSTHVDPTALCFTPPIKPRLSNSPTSHEDRSLSKDTVTAESPTSSLEQPRVSGGASHASSTQAGTEPRPTEMESSQRDARGEDELSSQETTPDDPDNDSDYDPRADVSPRRRKVARQTRQTAYSMPAAPRRGRMPGNEKEHGLLNPVESHERYMHDNMQMMASQQHGPYMAPPNVGGMLMGHPSYRYQPHHFQGPMMLPIQPLGSSQPLPFHQPIQPGPGVEYSEDDLTLVSRHRSKKRKRKTIVPVPPPVVKAFLCDAQGCGKRFRRSEHLKRHIRSLHTGEKPFPCATCGKTFSRTDNLSQHMRVHQPEARQIETKRKRKSRSG